jgi:hypothetical protein
MKSARFKNRRARSVTAFSLVFSVLWLAFVATLPLRARENSPPPPSVSSTQSVQLDYQELDYPVGNWNLPLDIQSAPFKKEPGFGLRKVLRGTLNFGNSRDQFIPFAWDQTSGKLYLDLNRNQDLTDDPGGVLSCSEPVWRSPSYQTFTNVHLAFKTPNGTHPVLANLHLYNYRQPNASVGSRSFWSGKISLQGQDWQVGIIENVSGKLGSAEDGFLLLRPWAARHESFDPQNGSLDGFHFCRNLFFGQQAYHLDYAYIQEAGVPKYKIDLEERRADLGELKLTGNFIKRIILPGAKFTVVLDQPAPVVKVPVGSYGQCQVQLKQGGAGAYREPARFSGSPTEKVTQVNAANPAVLKVGGPLTNSVAVNRHGRSLNLSYQLLGAGGEAYQLLGARRQPEFAAYRADKKIASGKFEFG